MTSEKQKVIKYIIRHSPQKGILEFSELLNEVAIRVLKKEKDLAERFVQSNVQRYWNYINSLIEQDIKKGIEPVLKIEDNSLKRFRWFFGENFSDIPHKKFHLLSCRHLFLQEIDTLNHRQFEALGCLTSELIGAKKTLLTPPGNEGGIDFIASIKFSKTSHFLFGVSGPIRIIGQCKKYSGAAQVSSIKEFNATLQDVYSLTRKMRSILPDWFRTEKGPIIGWCISHLGFQSGAIDRAKNYGVVISDSRDIAEVIAGSRNFYPNLHLNQRAKMLKNELSNKLV